MPGFDRSKRFYTWQGYAEYVKGHEKIARMSYKRHNAYVKVWNRPPISFLNFTIKILLSLWCQLSDC